MPGDSSKGGSEKFNGWRRSTARKSDVPPRARDPAPIPGRFVRPGSGGEEGATHSVG
jgi:hypothetical protein